jgi:hypothetical protein
MQPPVAYPPQRMAVVGPGSRLKEISRGVV